MYLTLQRVPVKHTTNTTTTIKLNMPPHCIVTNGTVVNNNNNGRVQLDNDATIQVQQQNNNNQVQLQSNNFINR